MIDDLLLDDLRIEQRFSSGPHVLQADEIKRFAGEFDPQPFHLDEEAAATSLPVGLASSDWHTAAPTMRLLLDAGAPTSGASSARAARSLGRNPRGRVIELHVVSELMEIIPSRSKPDRGILVLRSETRNQRDEVVQVLTSRLVVPRKPQAYVAPSHTSL
jgi:acyl dehydratase